MESYRRRKDDISVSGMSPVDLTLIGTKGGRMFPGQRKPKLPDKDSQLYIHLQMMFAVKLLDPENEQTLTDICHEFNTRFGEKKGIHITVPILLRWKRDPIFVIRKNSLQRRVEDQYAGEINRKLIEMCMKGSGFHMNIWYNRRGELVNKHQEIPADGLPNTQKELDDEIASLITRTQPLE